ncbi:MAG: hypothetical protein WBO44_03040 [Saprospiraceae bacterium]
MRYNLEFQRKTGIYYKSKESLQNSTDSTNGINLIPNYWTSTGPYLSSEATYNALYSSSSSSNQSSNASQTNNQYPHH